MAQQVLIQADVSPVCPNPELLCDSRCDECEQEWREMIILDGTATNGPSEVQGAELRVCSCGRVWRARLCWRCRRDQEEYEKADHDYDSRVEERIVARTEAVERMGGRF